MQLETARETAIKIVNDLDECIRELDTKDLENFEESLDIQFTRIFGIEMPSVPLTIEEFTSVIIPVLKRMCREDQEFFYKHYGEIVPLGIPRKFYL